MRVVRGAERPVAVYLYGSVKRYHRIRIGAYGIRGNHRAYKNIGRGDHCVRKVERINEFFALRDIYSRRRTELRGAEIFAHGNVYYLLFLFFVVRADRFHSAESGKTYRKEHKRRR